MLVQGERGETDGSGVNERIVFGGSRVAIGRIHDRSLVPDGGQVGLCPCLRAAVNANHVEGQDLAISAVHDSLLPRRQLPFSPTR